jgi:hypothetical protein
MQNLKIHQPDYLFTEKSRAGLEQNLNAKFLMDIDPGHGRMGALFYSENPDTTKGHVHYVFVRYDGVHAYISACDLQHVVGILEDGVFYYSAYVHDYVRTPKGQFIDGGVYYTRSSGKTVTMILDPKGPRIERNDHATNEEGETPEGRLPAGEAQAEEAAANV